MPVVSEQHLEARKPRRLGRWLIVVVAVVLIALLAAPMVRPILLVIGGDHYHVRAVQAGASPGERQGFSHSGAGGYVEVWQLRVGSWVYSVSRIPARFVPRVFW
jgi:hypothetical protein